MCSKLTAFCLFMIVKNETFMYVGRQASQPASKLACKQAIAGTISFSLSSGRMSNEIVAASSTPPRLSKCTRYTSANNLTLHIQQKPKRKRHKKPIATEVYCNIVKRVAVMQLFSVRLQFCFMLDEALCFILRKRFMVSFFSLELSRFGSRLIKNFTLFFAWFSLFPRREPWHSFCLVIDFKTCLTFVAKSFVKLMSCAWATVAKLEHWKLSPRSPFP